MRHRKRGRHLGRSPSHRIALLRNLANSLLACERIVTTAEKAKETRPFVEKLITIAKRGIAKKETDPAGYLHAYRRVMAQLQNEDVVKKLFGEGKWREESGVAARYADRPGGYTRILRLSGSRMGALAGHTGEKRELEYTMKGIEPTPVERKLKLVGKRLGDGSTRVMFELVETAGPEEEEPKAVKPKLKTSAKAEKADVETQAAQDQEAAESDTQADGKPEEDEKAE